MSSGRYAVIDTNNVVVNAIAWDGITPYDPGEGLSLVEIKDGQPYGIGWTYDPATGEFTPPPQPDPIPDPQPDPVP